MGPCSQLEESLFPVDLAETLHVQYTSDGSRSLTTLTSPRSVACMRPWAWCVPLSASHVQSYSDDSRLLTTLTTPCRPHPDWNDPEMGKTGHLCPCRRKYWEKTQFTSKKKVAENSETCWVHLRRGICWEEGDSKHGSRVN